MNQYYDKIMDLKGMDEIKSVVKKWERLSANIKKHPTDAPIILPDMLWVARSGVGKTKVLTLLSEYLFECGNLMSFYGDVRFFEFYLGYCDKKDDFAELQRLMGEVEHAAGFRNGFKGIVRIDVDEWIERYEEKHFIEFMEYLSSNSDNWLIILSVHTEDEQKLHNFEAFVSMYLRIERVSITLPQTADLMEYIESVLAKYGLSLTDDGKALLSGTVDKLRGNKYFDGYKSIGLLCQDIAYSAFSKEELVCYELDSQALSEFGAGSEYVNRTIQKIERAGKIGFKIN